MSILALLPKPRSDKARAAKIGSEVRKCLHPCSDRECVLRYCVGKPSRKSEQNKTRPKPNTDVIISETCSYINNEVLRHGPPCQYISHHEICMHHTPQNACESWFLWSQNKRTHTNTHQNKKQSSFETGFLKQTDQSTLSS